MLIIAITEYLYVQTYKKKKKRERCQSFTRTSKVNSFNLLINNKETFIVKIPTRYYMICIKTWKYI